MSVTVFRQDNAKVVEWFAGFGVDVSKARRIIVDLEVGQLGKIYVENFADGGMFDVILGISVPDALEKTGLGDRGAT